VHTSWPEPVERVAGFLRKAGVEARLEEFGSGTPTARDAARAAGCTLEQIVKTLVLVAGDDDPVVAMVPGDRRADLDKIAAAAGAPKARVASAAEVERITGFTPGAVAPFPLPAVGRIFIDRTLLAHDTVWIGAGSPAHIAAVRPADLQRLTRAGPIDAVLEPTYDAAAKGEPPHA
jgi:Cys-tRNA(Pro) deacylase